MPRNVSIKNLRAVEAARAARPAVMRPEKVNGKWRMAKMSAVAIARLRKRWLMQGRDWPWDIPHKIVEKRMPFKGHKRVLNAKLKREEIERCMKKMPQLIKEYRQNRVRKKKYSGLIEALIEERKREGVVERR